MNKEVLKTAIQFSVIAICTTTIIALPLLLIKNETPSQPFKCKGGYLFVKTTGYQLIGENGGGVKCEEQK